MNDKSKKIHLSAFGDEIDSSLEIQMDVLSGTR
jgi:hypothetical protein